jgi:S-adenosyl-L-methionine hydrolase (adenosine-forming)
LSGPIITLLSDFGLEDGYAASMKGVILEICPAARIIDVTHLIPPQDVRAGAYVLASVFRYFPKGTIHLAVVDPGVGTGRKPLAVRCSAGFFAGPDNGLFSLVLESERDWEARSIENPAFVRPEASRTFHGRDIFAPAAAHLACGTPFDSIGPRVSPVLAGWGMVEAEGDEVRGKVLHTDRFGNAITNVRTEHLERTAPLSHWTVRAADCILDSVSETYSDVLPGQVLALAGSSGYIEIAVNRGSAAALFGLRPGEKVRFVVRRG